MYIQSSAYHIPLQYLLYPAASVILFRCKPDPVILLLKILQWLPGSFRVKLQVLTMSHQALYDLDSAPYHLDCISYFLPLTYPPLTYSPSSSYFIFQAWSRLRTFVHVISSAWDDFLLITTWLVASLPQNFSSTAAFSVRPSLTVLFQIPHHPVLSKLSYCFILLQIPCYYLI